MFYSTQILTQKGVLGIIWVAAHLDKRLKVTMLAPARSRALGPATPLSSSRRSPLHACEHFMHLYSI